MATSHGAQEEQQLHSSTDHTRDGTAAPTDIYRWKQQLFDKVSRYDQEALNFALQQQKQLLALIQSCPIPAEFSCHDNAADMLRNEGHRSDILPVACAPQTPHTTHKIERDHYKAPKPVLISHDSGFEERHIRLTTRDLGALGRGHADTVVAIMIILNALTLLVHGEWSGWRISVELGIQEDDGRWQHAHDYFVVLEHFFSAFFLAELLVALYVNRRAFFADGFNWIDFVVVVCNSIDLYILAPLSIMSVVPLTVLRLLRILRLLRTLRIVRTVKLFNGLRLLVKAVLSCIVSLAWALVLIFIFTMMGGLLMNKLLEDEMFNPEAEYTLRHWCWTHYGTSVRAMYTMFEVTMAGCWPNYVRPLLDVSFVYALFFLVYVSFVCFAVTRVITAVFLKETLDAAASDAAIAIAERSHKKTAYLHKLEDVFRHADESGDGELSREEFDNIMRDPKVKMYLSALELEVHESSLLFELLDNGDGFITYDEFIQGVSRLKGQARTLDIVAVQIDIQKLLKHAHIQKEHNHPNHDCRYHETRPNNSETVMI